MLQGEHGMRLSHAQAHDEKPCMSEAGGSTEAWALTPLDSTGHLHTVRSCHKFYLGAAGPRTDALCLRPGLWEGAKWELLPVVGASHRFFLSNNHHGLHLASLGNGDKNQTPYLSKGRGDWEKWTVVIKGALPVEEVPAPIVQGRGAPGDDAAEAPSVEAMGLPPTDGPSQRVMLEGPHGMCLAVKVDNGASKLSMTMDRTSAATWTLTPPISELGLGSSWHALRSHCGLLLATRNGGEDAQCLTESMWEGARWHLTPCAVGSRFFLMSHHGKHLASLNDSQQTVYMSPGSKDWEKWKVLQVPKDDGTPKVVQVLLEEAGRPCPVEDAVRQLVQKQAVPAGRAARAGFTHQYPDAPVLYGRWFGFDRAPVVFLSTACEELSDYIRDDPVGPFSDLADDPPDFNMKDFGTWASWDFTVDSELLLKADWHTRASLGFDAEFFVPRLGGKGMLRRAPPRITAFMIAFRKVNETCWQLIMDALTALRRARLRGDTNFKASTTYSLLGTFIECFKNNRHFGVVEAQVRYGEGGHRQPSHFDGATSLLHMGMTLGGRRRFRAGVFPTQRERSEGNQVWDEKAWEPEHLRDTEIRSGTAYLTSPYCFAHAVEYDQSAQTEPIIALMCRFGFPADLGKLINNMRSEDMFEITTVLANCLKESSASGLLRMPSVKEVQNAEEFLFKHDTDMAGSCYG